MRKRARIIGERLDSFASIIIVSALIFAVLAECSKIWVSYKMLCYVVISGLQNFIATMPAGIA